MSDRIRTWTAVAVIVLSAVTVVAVLANSASAPPDRVHALAVRLKCPVCESESIADSPAQVARDSYDLIAEQVASGWTDQEIQDFFVATYGPSVLLDPPAGGSTAILWIAPIAAIAVGGVVIAGRLAGTGRELTAVERQRIERELDARR